jgi:predicted PurR-regulated permease PerM
MADASKIERLSAGLFYAAVVLLLWLVFLIVQPFLVPLAWAAILAILIMPWHSRLAARWGDTPAALVGTVGVTLGLVVPGVLLGIYFVREGIQAAQGLQDLAASGRLDWAVRIWASLARRIGQSNADLGTMLQDAARDLAAFLAGSVGGIVRNAILFILDLFIMLFALFYFLRDRKAIMAMVRRLLPFEESLRELMLADADRLIHASVTVSLFIAVLQGTICGLAFALTGIGAPVFWGLVMSFLALLPVVGAWPVWLPAGIWLLATGQIGRGILLLAICGVIAGTIDNVLRPILLSGRSSLGGFMVFVSVLGGIAAFGMIGLILGPIIFAMALAVLDVYTRKPRHG